MAARWVLVTTVLLAASANAQDDPECDEGSWGRWQGGPAGRACEVRGLTLPAGGTLSIDARQNGSIRVTGENRRDVEVRAIVHAWGRDEADAEALARAVNVRTDGVVRAEGPSRGGRYGWSVSYRVLVPRETDLNLETVNGSIAIADVRGSIVLETTNGHLTLDRVGGNVQGRTTNGGVDAELAGRAWEGEGLALETTNGGVRLRIPEDYSARIEARTVHGGIDVDFPITVQGRIGRELATTLGRGGPLIRAETTNGGVRISRARGDLRRLP
jgi:hypothetical protein